MASANNPEAVDVCLIVEGAYPYVSGGVSSWVHGLIRRQPDIRFCVVAILPEPPPPVSKYGPLPNLVALHHLYLTVTYRSGGWFRPHAFDQAKFDEAVGTFLHTGGLPELARIIGLMAPLVKARRTADLLNSNLAWKLVCDLYDRAMPHESFLHFFWAWRALFGGLVATLSFPLPPARVYHTVSTGYAGLLAARAAVETGRPMLITEHGIYTHERRIEILQADWIVDTVDKGFAIHDPRRDLRDFWSAAFESYARACYQACTEVITLHGANQPAQIGLGAAPDRLKIIPNGVDYQGLSRLPAVARRCAADGRAGRTRRADQGHHHLSARDQDRAHTVSGPGRAGARPDRRAARLLRDLQGRDGGARAHRHGALHGPGRRHRILPAHPCERADEPRASRSRSACWRPAPPRSRRSPPMWAPAAKFSPAGATRLRRSAKAAC